MFVEKEGDPLVRMRLRLAGVRNILAEELESLNILLETDVEFLD